MFTVSGATLEGLINPRLIEIKSVEQIPKLQIALPIGFKDWNGTIPIKVAYTPLTIDDTEWDVVYAYDAAGNEYTLDAHSPPDFPVMVVSINERTDMDGNVTYRVPNQGTNTDRTSQSQGIPIDDFEKGGGGGSGSGSSIPNQIRIKRFKLETTYKHFEAWPQENAEITWTITAPNGLNGPRVRYTNNLDDLKRYISYGDVLRDKYYPYDILFHDHAKWHKHNWLYGEYHTKMDWQTHNYIIDHANPNPSIRFSPSFKVSELLSKGIPKVNIRFFEKDEPYPYSYTYMGTTPIDLRSSGIVDGVHIKADKYLLETWFKIDYDIVP